MAARRAQTRQTGLVVTVSTARDLTWLRPITSPAAPAVRLVCFPHAGGTAGVFHGWGTRVPDDVEVLAVRYPGRQDRLGDPFIETMAPLADAVTAALSGWRDVPLVLFGHSMGASVAHEVARRLAPAPALLVVSARRPPHLLRSRPAHFGDDDLVIADVKRLGAESATVLDHPELRDLVLPAIRADYRLTGNYQPGALPGVDVPIVAYLGADDPNTSTADLREWSTASTRGFDLKVFPGGHFYLVEHESAVVADLVARLSDHR
ncbi:thioesterase [Actinokineospora sp. HBU206404]|uniref:Thioesterase n=1 Tax=Actinokineospora xionganensis TaxID=2684470 RepID=A0ABR7L435_9PSEU|nr:thioesterase [Actinokineospora xionganensis]